ncbi:hypothetical protein Tco_1202895 [Tanacetum coccineum]
MSSSSHTSKSKRRTITLQELIAATHCDCPIPIKEQVSWTSNNPGRRFKGCPIRDKKKKCEFFGFLDVELPSEYYKDLLYKMHVENKKLKDTFKSSDSIEVNEISQFQMQQMKEELTFIKSKVSVYDKNFMFLSLVVVMIGIVIAISVMNYK